MSTHARGWGHGRPLGTADLKSAFPRREVRVQVPAGPLLTTLLAKRPIRVLASCLALFPSLTATCGGFWSFGRGCLTACERRCFRSWPLPSPTCMEAESTRSADHRSKGTSGAPTGPFDGLMKATPVRVFPREWPPLVRQLKFTRSKGSHAYSTLRATPRESLGIASLRMTDARLSQRVAPHSLALAPYPFPGSAASQRA